MKKFLIMKNIDIFSFDLVEKFKALPMHQKVVDQYNILEEWQQAISKFVLMVLTFLIPLIFLLISYSYYSGKKSELARYESYISDAATITSQTKQLYSKANSVFAQPVTNKGILNSKLSSILGAVGVDAANANITDFNLVEIDGVNEVTATIAFKDLTDNNLFAFMRRLLFIDNYKINTFHIEKFKDNNLLRGELGVGHYSKVQLNEEE